MMSVFGSVSISSLSSRMHYEVISNGATSRGKVHVLIGDEDKKNAAVALIGVKTKREVKG